MYWLLVSLVESLKSSHKEAPRKLIFVRITKTLQAQLATFTKVHIYTLYFIIYKAYV